MDMNDDDKLIFFCQTNFAGVLTKIIYVASCLNLHTSDTAFVSLNVFIGTYLVNLEFFKILAMTNLLQI